MRRMKWFQSLDKDFSEHLKEAAKRLAFSVVFYCAALCFCVANTGHIFDVFTMPFRSAGFELISLSPGDSLLAVMTMILATAFLIAMPLVILEITGFVMPAVKDVLQNRIRLLAIVMTALFLAGVLFAFFIILPFFSVFVADNGALFGIERTVSIKGYVSFVCMLSFCMGVGFEMPVLVLLLWVFGFLSSQRLRRCREIFYLTIFAGAAVITPPDVVSQFMVALPMIALFEIGNFCGFFMTRKLHRK